MQSITFWLMGSLAGSKWENIAFVLPVILIITLFFIGSGKSTFLKCIYHVLKPDGDDILLDDAPISAFSVRETVKRLAVLSPHNYYNFEFPVRDIVLMGRSLHKRMMERDTKADFDIVEDSLRRVGMLGFIDRMRRFSGAWLNVVFRGFEDVGEALKARLGMDYIAVDFPYGAEGSRSFLAKIDAALGTDHGPEIEAGLAHAAESAKKALHPLRLIYQAEAAVADDFMRAQAMTAFLRSELGLRISAEMDDRDPSADAGKWMEQVRRSGTVLAFGSSFQRQVEDEIPARLIRFSYPVMDAVTLGHQPYAGFDGLDFLLSDILNALLTLPYRRHGQFNS